MRNQCSFTQSSLEFLSAISPDLFEKQECRITLSIPIVLSLKPLYRRETFFLNNEIVFEKLHWLQLFAANIFRILNLSRDQCGLQNHQPDFSSCNRSLILRSSRDKSKKLDILATKNCNQCNSRNFCSILTKVIRSELVRTRTNQNTCFESGILGSDSQLKFKKYSNVFFEFHFNLFLFPRIDFIRF